MTLMKLIKISTLTGLILFVVGCSCGGGSSSGSLTPVDNGPSPNAPAGLTYSVNPASYTINSLITNNIPSTTGGEAVVSYSISPTLPAGLNFNTTTGIITGTPTVLSASATYTITATNSSGSTNVSLQLAVVDVPPSNLSYSNNPASYIVGSNNINGLGGTTLVPTIGGGSVVSYSISPALPTGLSISTTTGVISGTPTVQSNTTIYTVTATNSGGSVTAVVNLTVNAGNFPIGQVNTLGFQSPTYIDIDSGGNIYVMDNAARIIKHDRNGIPLSVVGEGLGDANSGKLLSAFGIKFNSVGELFVLDSFRLKKFDSAGNYLTTHTTIGAGDGQQSLTFSFNLDIDASNNLYVADRGNNRIQKFNSSGVAIGSMGRTSASTGSCPAGTVTNSFCLGGTFTSGAQDGGFNAPVSVVNDTAGNIYVADRGNNRLQKFNSAGNFIGAIGNSTASTGTCPVGATAPGWCTGGTFAAGGAGNGQFNIITDVTLDNAGDLLVIDSNRIQRINSNTGAFVSQFGSTGTADGQMSNPSGLAVDAGNNILLADSGNARVQKFNSSGVYQSQFGKYGSANYQLRNLGGVGAPGSGGIDVDSAGSIFATNSNAILIFNSAGIYQSQFGGAGAGNGQFGSYAGRMFFDSSDILHVIDRGNSRVQKFNSSGVYQSQFGSAGIGDGQLSGISDIVVDSAGNIYVSEASGANHHRVQKFNSAGAFIGSIGLLSASVGTCPASGAAPGWCTGGTFAQGGLNGQFSNIESLAIDSSDNIYVLDSSGRRVQKFNSAGAHMATFSYSNGTGNGQISTGTGIKVDASGNIYITDSQNNRVQKFDSAGVYQSQFGTYGINVGQFNYAYNLTISPANNIFVIDMKNNRIQKFDLNGNSLTN